MLPDQYEDKFVRFETLEGGSVYLRPEEVLEVAFHPAKVGIAGTPDFPPRVYIRTKSGFHVVGGLVDAAPVMLKLGRLKTTKVEPATE